MTAAEANRTVESVVYPRLAALIEAIIREHYEAQAGRKADS